MLKIEKLNAGYNKKPIIKNISFSPKPGDLTGLLGLNGSGKTTLLKTISGLIKPMDGKCYIGDQDIHSLNEKDRAKLISFMPQNHSIIYDTQVLDIVLMGVTPYLSAFDSPNQSHRDQAYKALETMEIGDYAQRNFLHLSEGQKQLIVIARNLLQNSKIMLFDEPDSSLDFPNKHMVLEKIKEIVARENKTGIITLHDPNLALKYCQNIIILKEGKIFTIFNKENINQDQIYKNFQTLYGHIEVVNHKGKYIIIK